MMSGIIHAVESDNFAIFNSLHYKGEKINLTYENGQNLLHIAARNNSLKIAEFILINELISPQNCDSLGNPPLHYAASSKMKKLLKIRTIAKENLNPAKMLLERRKR